MVTTIIMIEEGKKTRMDSQAAKQSMKGPKKETNKTTNANQEASSVDSSFPRETIV